jgi:hypothetical protein
VVVAIRNTERHRHRNRQERERRRQPPAGGEPEAQICQRDHGENAHRRAVASIEEGLVDADDPYDLEDEVGNDRYLVDV